MLHERAAPFVIPEDVLGSLARRHLAGIADVFVAPDIPAGKLRRAREEHRLHLAANEPVVVLFDATALGGARDGFLVTPAQLCWKGFLEHPRRILWDELAALPVRAEARHVEIASGEVPAPWASGGSERVRDFLEACAQHRRAASAPYRAIAPAREPATLAEAIVRIARRRFGEREWIHYRPSIPVHMLDAVRTVHARHMAPDEEVLVLYDDTVFGSGNDGLVLTERGVCWRGFLSAAGAMLWSHVEPEDVGVDGEVLRFADRHLIDLRMRPGLARTAAGALAEIAAEVARAADRTGRG